MDDPRRAAVIAEARSWIRTPYHHMGRIKGAGCDCLTLLAEVYERAGIIGHVEIPFYRPDFMRHRDGEPYLEGVLAHGREVAIPEPGDAALWRFGRCLSHAAIVVAWPQVIHADSANGVTPADGTQGHAMGRAVRFFSPFRS
jgi:cell wall-associated NlpC family hydrolase